VSSVFLVTLPISVSGALKKIQQKKLKKDREYSRETIIFIFLFRTLIFHQNLDSFTMHIKDYPHKVRGTNQKYCQRLWSSSGQSQSANRSNPIMWLTKLIRFWSSTKRKNMTRFLRNSKPLKITKTSKFATMDCYFSLSARRIKLPSISFWPSQTTRKWS